MLKTTNLLDREILDWLIVVYCHYVWGLFYKRQYVCFSYERNWWGLFYKRQYVCLAMNVTDEGYSTNVTMYV